MGREDNDVVTIVQETFENDGIKVLTKHNKAVKFTRSVVNGSKVIHAESDTGAVKIPFDGAVLVAVDYLRQRMMEHTTREYIMDVEDCSAQVFDNIAWVHIKKTLRHHLRGNRISAHKLQLCLHSPYG
jgi:hypothetical protein